MNNWDLNPKILSIYFKKQRETKDLPFITDQFTSLAFTMHEIYEFGKFEIQQIQNKNESISNQPGITVSSYFF